MRTLFAAIAGTVRETWRILTFLLALAVVIKGSGEMATSVGGTVKNFLTPLLLGWAAFGVGVAAYFTIIIAVLSGLHAAARFLGYYDRRTWY